METSDRCEEMLAAPGREELHDGPKGLAFRRESVFYPGRDFGVRGTNDEPVVFEFFELTGEDFERHTGDDAVNLAKP